jgi:metal-dependent amidase/aminoacylase/carboxypeptidase family protein
VDLTRATAKVDETGKLIEHIAQTIALAHHATIQFSYHVGLMPLVNDSAMVKIIRDAAREIGGEEKVTLAPPTLGGEDFAQYAQLVPAAFVFLGGAFADRENHPAHHPKFDIDESALSIGAAVLSLTAFRFLHT